MNFYETQQKEMMIVDVRHKNHYILFCVSHHKPMTLSLYA